MIISLCSVLVNVLNLLLANVMRKMLLHQLKRELEYYKKLKKSLEEDLHKQKISIKNSRYLRLLSKLYSIDQRIDGLKQTIKQIKRQNQFTKRFIITLRSKVKLVSLDFKVVLWVDARNVTNLLGRQVGEIIELYNAAFKIEAIY
ncbi:MAG: hypothetical protein US52_C0023G0014 [candidate division WS6 bacterium GW2011_GWA2_37_6]|uniref:Uncharacterized protein n=1 Tax=candidate division WS6 bacterium GW2011_GWA2_37_6 TaxID=1619087 RepID=A0A0G0JFH7_9BACT|nr:MAG: hypothetical protein US52_C0023G0014 [candidate division WS6 bacterium GW2011_GWA2_37_6]